MLTISCPLFRWESVFEKFREPEKTVALLNLSAILSFTNRSRLLIECKFKNVNELLINLSHLAETK